MKYFVSLGDRTIVVEVAGDTVAVDGQPVAACLQQIAGTPEVRVEIDGIGSVLAVEGHEGTSWRLVDRGALRELTVEDERSRHIRLLAGSAKAVDGHSVLKAPMPGMVLRVLVAVGDRVGPGTPLLALEAMKMENELKAAAPGVVTAVLVVPGRAVEKGEKLLEIGPQP